MSVANQVQKIPAKRSRCILAVGFYFFICGISALIWPSIWYELAGLGTKPLGADLVLAVLGVMMTGLGIGAFISSSRKEELLLLKMYLVANVGDAIVVALFILNGMLPVLNGVGFIMLDLFWSAALAVTYFQYKNSN